MQYLEGNQKQIIGLYDKIKEDDRHKGAVLLINTPIKERSFPSWQMGAKKFDQKTIDFKTDISSEDKAVFDSVLSGQTQKDERAVAIMKKFFV